MTSQTKKRRPGRPRKGTEAVIDLARVRELCQLHVTLLDLAVLLGVSIRSVKWRMEGDAEFRAAWDAGRAEGRRELLDLQRQVARSGNATMLIWLGKQNLGQSDNGPVDGDTAPKPGYGVLMVPGLLTPAQWTAAASSNPAEPADE